jgi:hypothetical protein
MTTAVNYGAFFGCSKCTRHFQYPNDGGYQGDASVSGAGHYVCKLCDPKSVGKPGPKYVNGVRLLDGSGIVITAKDTEMMLARGRIRERDGGGYEEIAAGTITAPTSPETPPAPAPSQAEIDRLVASVDSKLAAAKASAKPAAYPPDSGERMSDEDYARLRWQANEGNAQQEFAACSNPLEAFLAFERMKAAGRIRIARGVTVR